MEPCIEEALKTILRISAMQIKSRRVEEMVAVVLTIKPSLYCVPNTE